MSQALKSAIENQELINQVLIQFNQKISSLENTYVNCGLLSGLSGDLLFLYKLSQYNSDLVDESVFNDKLEFLQSQLAMNVDHPDLSNGLSGQGWFLEYVNQAQEDDYDPELCEEIDDILLNVLSVDSWKGEIEMVIGLSGIAMYAGRRQLKSAPEALFEKIINHFENIAIQTSDNTLAWSQPSDSVYRFNKDEVEVPEYNLGLAHGVPSIIAAILPALTIPSLFERTKRLLIQSCDWLLAQELKDKDRISCFGSSCNDDSGSRLGWCYGDLTIALTLARVGNALEMPSYIDKAKQIGLHAAARDEKEGMINDAGLCHGSAGLALIFQLLNQQLNEEKFLEVANKWLTYSLDLYQNKGMQGFYMYSGLSKSHEEDTGLLMGYGGIGLCLLAALGEDADWADCLLLA
ncbi:lanthionine synthetase C family protein [Pseudoalteromonas denitrificans]|uniref:Lanthionine synthetase C-like protein n=1 Tax=Pseudoalteromonas denitrificans DSM 6059 TaxID=1123010 RepID=A0A1I1I426_9GAMM|nr:lanthionine synthetase C family protein [Pseudoalteromonas denitrificans]SFC30841.1 Lanthionine synthetase C-like protein [Pseudoalteromonas denitrificans DSM 6059]